MYGYGYRYNSGLVVGAGGGAPFTNTYSLDFDGVDDYVDLGDSDDFSFGNGATDSPFSISAWIKMDDASAFRVATKYENANREYLFTTDSSDRLSLALYDNSNGTRIQRKYNTALTSFQGQWINVVGTYDGSSLSSGIKIYLNGTRVDDIDGNLGTYIAMENTTQPLEIGRSNLTSFSNGKIDEVAIFNTALTPTEITSIALAPTDLTDLSPIAWYRMGDNGAYKSPQWLLPSNENKDKVSNYSFQLDGVDDYINCGNPTDLQITGAFTLSVWTKLDSTVGTQACAISKDNGTSERAFTLWSKIVNKPVFYIWNGATSYNVGGTTNIADDTWHHVAVVYVPSTSIRIYVDGVLEGTNTTSIPASINNANYDFKLGHFAGSLFEFKGLMDEVSVFNSAVDIATLYNSGTPTTLPSGAVAHYKMGEEATFSGGVWTVPDNVGSNNGTSNAMTIEDRVGDAPNSENNALSYNMDEVDRVTDTP